jgi:hypothetical protein
MFKMPAVCQRCGTIFPSSYVASSAFDVMFSGNQAGPCPSCGGVGNVIDGTFDFVGNVIRVRAASPETIDVLRRLQGAIAAANAAASPAEAVAEATRSLPEAREEIAKSGASGKAVLVAILLAAMSSCSNSVKFDTKLDINDLIRQAREISISRSLPGHLPTSAGSSSPPSTQTPQTSAQSKDPAKTPSPDGSTPRSK